MSREALLELQDVVGAKVPAVGGEELQTARRLCQSILKTDEFRLAAHESQAQVQYVGGQDLKVKRLKFTKRQLLNAIRFDYAVNNKLKI